MRSGSVAVIVWLLAVGTGCDREPVAAEPAAAPAESESKSETSPARERSWGPWGRAAEAEEAAREAEQEALRAKQALELERKAEALAELDRKAAALEREAAALERGMTAPTTPTEPAPMSREEPELRVLPAPPFAYTLNAEAPLAHQGPQPKLVKRSSKRNAIIDVDAWFLANRLTLPIYALPPRPARTPFPAPPRLHRGPGDPLPPAIPVTFAGHGIAKAIRSTDATVAIYGPGLTRVVAYDDLGDSFGALDFSAYGRAMDVRWAEAHLGVLYVCTSNLHYASESGGLNAFITAIELRSGTLLWQSDPLVCNSHEFVIHDGWIISGYGYTAEPDFLFVIDMKTGATVQRVPVASGPDELVEKDGELFVRTYDRDYVFELR